MDDVFLVQQVLSGNAGAFRFLVLRHQRPVFNLLGGLMKDRATAEDLAQETFLRAFRALCDFDPARGAVFSTWLLTIARNLAYNELAKRRVRERPDVSESQDTASTRADDALMDARRSAAVREAVASLPEVFRAPVLLSCFEGCSCAEIARIEGCSEGTVKSRIHRGKARLRELLAPLFRRPNDEDL